MRLAVDSMLSEPESVVSKPDSMMSDLVQILFKALGLVLETGGLGLDNKLSFYLYEF